MQVPGELSRFGSEGKESAGEVGAFSTGDRITFEDVRTFFRAVSVVLLSVGLPGAGLAIVALTYSSVAPVQPPPSLNEGPGLATMVGWMLLIPSAVAVVAGVALHLRLNASQRPEDVALARARRRLW